MKIDSNTTGGGESPGCYYDVYQGDNLALEIDDPDGLADNFWANGTVRENDASVSHRYLYGAAVDEILASENAAGVIPWGLADNEGTIRDIVNGSTRAVVDHRNYDSYGNVTFDPFHPPISFSATPARYGTPRRSSTTTTTAGTIPRRAISSAKPGQHRRKSLPLLPR